MAYVTDHNQISSAPVVLLLARASFTRSQHIPRNAAPDARLPGAAAARGEADGVTTNTRRRSFQAEGMREAVAVSGSQGAVC